MAATAEPVFNPTVIISTWRLPVLLSVFVLSALSQLLLLLGYLPWQAGQNSAWWWSLIEMGFMLLLLGLAAQLWWRVKAMTALVANAEFARIRGVSCLLMLSLALASGGDLINKNLQQEAFAYDQWIQHSYLIDSMLCFFPAYSLVLWAVLSTCRSQWQSRGRATLFTVAVLVLGSLAWWDAYHVNMAWLPAAAIWAYSVLMLGLLLSAVLLARQWGWRQSWPVVLGLVLAVLADGLIGQFWLSTNTYYPQIRFVNWIVYFSSQVLLQFLPIMLLRRLNADSEPL